MNEFSGAGRSRADELLAAGIKVGVALIVAAVLLVLYSRQVKVEAQVQDLLAGARVAGGRSGGARAELSRDTPSGWLAAEAAFQRALDLQPSNPYALSAFADVEAMLAGAGYDDRGPRADDALLRAEARNLKVPERFEAHALRLIQGGRAGEAEAYLLALLSKYGSVPRLIDALGRAQRASGKLAEAKASFHRAQEAEWRSPRNVADYAQMLLEEGAAPEAVGAFDRALQANSEHLRSLIGKSRAQAKMRGGDLKLAGSILDGVLARGVDELPSRLRATALSARAEIKLAKGDVAGAAADANEAVRSQPALAAALHARALVAAAAPATRSEALSDFKAAIAADPYDASTYFDGAAALAAAGDDSAAEKLLGAYAATLPLNARYQLALAQLLVRKGDDAGAASALQKAQALEPANAAVWFEQGRLAQRRHDQKAAVAAYERAASLRDDYPEVYRQMGSLYLENKDVQDALRVFTEALARYRAEHTPVAQLETFYSDVQQQIAHAGKSRLAAEWVKEARALR